MSAMEKMKLVLFLVFLSSLLSLSPAEGSAIQDNKRSPYGSSQLLSEQGRSQRNIILGEFEYDYYNPTALYYQK